MDRSEVVLKLKPLFVSFLEQKGFVLVDMRLFKDHHGRLIFEVLADRTEGGITIDECAGLGRDLAEVIEQSGYLTDDYMLDVSSPGIDRPLVVYSDFLRVKGREVNVFLKEAVSGRVEHRGIVESVDIDKVVIKTMKKKEIKTIEIPLNKVNKAKQVIL
ncbi:MAG: hypothetical protein ABIC68_02210 [Candidatus Omnitrophota bacterium]